MTVTLSAYLLEEVAEALSDVAQDEIRVSYDYSGRGMFGRTCVGFSGQFSEVQLGLVLAHVVTTIGAGDDLDVAELASLSWERDNLGRDIIVYARDLACEDAPSAADRAEYAEAL